MYWTKVALGTVLIWSGTVACAASAPVPQTVGFGTGKGTAKSEPLSEGAANQAVCVYRAKLAYEVVNFRAKGGKRELFQVRFSDRVDPELKASTLAAVDLAFDAKGTPEEVATLIYRDCTGTRI